MEFCFRRGVQGWLVGCGTGKEVQVKVCLRGAHKDRACIDGEKG